VKIIFRLNCSLYGTLEFDFPLTLLIKLTACLYPTIFDDENEVIVVDHETRILNAKTGTLIRSIAKVSSGIYSMRNYIISCTEEDNNSSLWAFHKRDSKFDRLLAKKDYHRMATSDKYFVYLNGDKDNIGSDSEFRIFKESDQGEIKLYYIISTIFSPIDNAYFNFSGDWLLLCSDAPDGSCVVYWDINKLKSEPEFELDINEQNHEPEPFTAVTTEYPGWKFRTDGVRLVLIEEIDSEEDDSRKNTKYHEYDFSPH